MKNITVRPVLGKLMFIIAILMPILIILEVLPTEKAIIIMVLAVIGCSIYCWGYKGGVISALYSSLMTLCLFTYTPWAANSYSPYMMVTFYLLTGIGGAKVVTSIQKSFRNSLVKKTAYVTGRTNQLPDLIKEVKQAKIELDIARQNFEYAEEDTIDKAVIKLNDAIKKYDMLKESLDHNWDRHLLTVEINAFPRS